MSISIWNRAGFRQSDARRNAALALAVSYPILAHAAILRQSTALTLVCVIVLAAAVLLPPLTEGRRWAWLALPLAAAAIAALWYLDAAALVLFLPPILLNLFLAWFFGHTLRRGSTPLIERLVRLLQPPGEPPEAAVILYARRLTRAWTLLFAILAAINLALAGSVVPGGLLDSAGLRPPAAIDREVWSLFANVLNYVVVAAFFLLEFFYRMRRFPGRPYRNLLDFLRRAAAVGPQLMATFRAKRVEAPERGAPKVASTTGTLEMTMEIPAEHPAFAGHFPGRPLLPGVVLLEYVTLAAEQLLGRPLRLVKLPWVKFQAPLEPGDVASIRLRCEGETLHFEVRRGALRIARGVFEIAADRKPA